MKTLNTLKDCRLVQLIEVIVGSFFINDQTNLLHLAQLCVMQMRDWIVNCTYLEQMQTFELSNK